MAQEVHVLEVLNKSKHIYYCMTILQLFIVHSYFSELVRFWLKTFNECNEGYNHSVLEKFYGNLLQSQIWPKPWIITFAP